ncbi:hypothetical protein H6P81_009694 [Aristolochia fimbriata]|uniref:Secreted protein n=1 Tax=Aristolochia fimbriata TaxID=158543 RepID=A0AAV7EME0_ARIFI|nr:hypothetical protein H6P81_009694 [Aristolochia fimbriata]
MEMFISLFLVFAAVCQFFLFEIRNGKRQRRQAMTKTKKMRRMFCVGNQKASICESPSSGSEFFLFLGLSSSSSGRIFLFKQGKNVLA